jgi:hypothetical protein
VLLLLAISIQRVAQEFVRARSLTAQTKAQTPTRHKRKKMRSTASR